MAMDESSGGNGRRNKKLILEDDKKENRISDLPDSIIHHILSQAIQTGILSKRWYNEWTSVPVLVFDSARSIDSTLFQLECLKIKKLYLTYNFKNDSNFPSKIRFATRKHVEELILNCYYGDPKIGYQLPKFLFDNPFLVKLEISNCCFKYDWIINWRSLKSFKMDRYASKNLASNVLQGSPSLESFQINSHGIASSYSIVSKSLKILILQEVDIRNVNDIEISCPNLEQLCVKSSSNKFAFLPDVVIESVVSGCLLLVSLELVNCSFAKLDIASKSLKKLVLENLYSGCIIEISCPNLEKLSVKSSNKYYWLPAVVIESVVSGCLLFRSLELVNCWFEKLDIASKSLKKLVLENIYSSCIIEISCPNLEEFKSNGIHHVTFNMMNVPTDQYDGYYNEDYKAKRIFQQLQNVAELTIASWFIKILSDHVGMRGTGLSYRWDSNKSLTLDGPDFEHLPGIMCALRSSPKLEKLIINLQVHEGGKNSINFEFSTKNIGIQLKTVEIIGLSKKDDKYKLVLCFIKFILKCAKVLKKLVLVISKDGGSDFAFKVSQQVSSYPRSSKHAIVELLCS